MNHPSNLDIKSIRELAEVITLWKNQGKTILIAEHRLSYLMDLADRVLYMKDGQIENDFSIADFRKIPPDEISRMGLRSLYPGDIPQSSHFYSKEQRRNHFIRFPICVC